MYVCDSETKKIRKKKMRGTGRTRLSQPHSTHHDDGKQDFRLKFGGALQGS